ncbi:hypothetical protein OSB04_000134 [Centaurea solstitialis]|uniref:Cyclin-dependent protein kinase inhibitor SMR6 n=1 Tax=Centaurea solstitialis TaxID=347529 RepID=A0AA38TVZ5_9ASTR|nr:hypothetical protein OSB04_000134 [Centaurea solstitialis]
MGISKKQHQLVVVDGGESLEGKKWVIGGIAMRAPLRSISTRKVKEEEEEDGNTNSDSGVVTPKSKESTIPATLPCPPPPRKRRPAVVTGCRNGNREFFTSPELDSLFMLLSSARKAN